MNVHKRYQWLVLDMDGTLLDNKKRLLPSTYNALMAVQREGVKLVIATGRPTFGCMSVVEQLELQKYDGYLFSYNGGKVTSCQTGQVHARRTIPLDLLPSIYRIAKEYQLPLLTYRRNEIVAECDDNQWLLWTSEVNHQMPIRVVPSLLEAVTREPFMYTIIGEEAELQKVESHLQTLYPSELGFRISDQHYLDIVPKEVDKGSALQFLLKDQEASSETVIAVGDSYNDMSMLAVAGLGVAMSNAPEAVKRVADYITKSNDEDGIYHLVNKFILAPEVSSSDIPDLETLNKMMRHTLMGNLGIKCTILRPGYVEATMPVDQRTQQPLGILHGGASLALAETIAGYGSTILLKEGEILVGMQVSGNHISSALAGETVKGVATIIHQGRSTHVWNVDVVTQQGRLISTIRVINSILNKR